MAKRNGANKSGSTDKVGYKNPPKHTRFQPGISGNPRGRRKKEASNFDASIESVYNSTVTITDGTGRKKITLREALIRKETELAAKGDIRALRSCISRMEKQSLTNTLPWPKNLDLRDLSDKQLEQLILRLEIRTPEAKDQKDA